MIKGMYVRRVCREINTSAIVTLPLLSTCFGGVVSAQNSTSQCSLASLPEWSGNETSLISRMGNETSLISRLELTEVKLELRVCQILSDKLNQSLH